MAVSEQANIQDQTSTLAVATASSSHTNNDDGEQEAFGPEARDVIFTIPNLISLIRILSIPCIAYLISQRQLLLSLVVLMISSATDGLDGYIARRFNQVSRIGQLLDPIADRLLIICSMLALGWAHIVPWWLLIAVGVRDLIMLMEILVLADHGYGPLPVHFVGKAGTALLLMCVPILIIGDLGSQNIFTVLHLIGVAGAIWGIGLYWVAGVIYISQGVVLITHLGRQNTE